MHMHMHRSGQLRDVLRPKQGAAGGDDSTGEGEDCAASSLHALHELWNVRDEHAAEVLTLTLTPTLTLTLTLTLVLTTRARGRGAARPCDPVLSGLQPYAPRMQHHALRLQPECNPMRPGCN